MIDLNERKTLINNIVSELLNMNYEDLNKIFGSETIKEIRALKNDIKIDEICEFYHITKEEYAKHPDEYQEDYYLCRFT